MDVYRSFRRNLVIVICLLLVGVAYLLYRDSHFRIVSTNPGTGSVATLSPFLKINFDRQLSRTDLLVTSTPHITSSYEISDKTLEINLVTPLVAGDHYIINVASVQDVSGDRLSNLSFNFSPINVSVQNLPKDQQAAILKTQQGFKNSTNSITFVNTDLLINVGLTTTQVYELESDFKNFRPNSKEVKVIAGSISHAAYNPDVDTSFTLYFNVSFDSQIFKASDSYSGLNDTDLTLYNISTGATIYSSPAVTQPGGD